MNGHHFPLRTTFLVSLLGCAAAVHAQGGPASPIRSLGMPVSVARLAAVRGGFNLGDGLDVSFGIQRAVYVDGNLVTYLNVSIPDVAHITSQQAASLAAALGTINVQVGQGNSFDPSAMAQASAATVTQALAQGFSGNGSGQVASNSAAQGTLGNPLVRSDVIPASAAAQANAATVIQNTVNNQVISSLTTLNVAVSALNALRNQGLQQSLQAAQQLQH